MKKVSLVTRVYACLRRHGKMTTGEIADKLGEERKRIQTALGVLQNQERAERTDEEGTRRYAKGATPHRWRAMTLSERGRVPTDGLSSRRRASSS